MWGLGCRWGWLGLVGLSLVLGDCVWCVLLPKVVANATLSSKTTPRLVITNYAVNTRYHPNIAPYGNKNHVK